MSNEANNRKIADFMGYIHSKHKDLDDYEMTHLAYDTDWNSLMPVVEKCYAISRAKQKALPDSKDLDDPTGWRAWSYRDVALSTKIDAVYKRAIEFIEFYNNDAQTS